MKNLYDYERTQSATTDLPFGALKNESSPGKQDGTDIVAEHIQDLAYSLYQVLQLAGINPNGELEDGNNKTQFIESLTNIGVFRYSDKTSYNYGVFAWQVIGNTFTLYRSLKNSNSDDVNNNESWLKILEIGADNKINFNVDTNILGLSANPSLSNLSEAGEDRLNVSKMYETGAVSNDTKGFEALLKRAHSTFDKSKFEVVGSLSITDNGIASGFSNENTINIQVLDLSSNDFEIDLKFNYSENNSSQQLFRCATDKYGGIFGFLIATDTNNKLYISGTTSDVKYNTPLVNSEYYLKLKIKGSNATVVLNGQEIITGAWNKSISTAYITIGSNFNGSINLKSFSIWADGIPVFNGNKTGLDVIKEDNYEIIGSPTITEDGIASVFSNNDYIKSNYEFDLTKSWETRITFRTPNSNLQYDSGIGQFEGNLNNNSLSIRADYKLYANFNTGVNLRLISNVIMEKNTKYTAVIGWDLRNYYLEILDHTCKLIDTIKLENNAPLAISDSKRKYRIGKIFDFADGRYKFQGSIDLNAFKIYVDGSLVYQPCLKIPYTEAFEHSKIVDVAYRNRVQDLYEQTGEALFYTLDEQNQNFTVPSGDIYGMITKNREILDIVYPIGRPMPEENNVLLDNEVWLEGATVNIVDYPKLFKVYGTKYGGNGTTTFKLPDLRNRVLWGSSDGSNGYIESKLPNIKGDFILGGDGGTHPQTGSSAASGAYQFTSTSSGATFENTGAGQTRYDNINFNASRSNSIYSDSTKIVQPPAFKVRWKTRFE